MLRTNPLASLARKDAARILARAAKKIYNPASRNFASARKRPDSSPAAKRKVVQAVEAVGLSATAVPVDSEAAARS